jgi:hypothetical protein
MNNDVDRHSSCQSPAELKDDDDDEWEESERSRKAR